MEYDEADRNAAMALLDGDMRGLETLVRLYRLRALCVAYAITDDRQLAEECVTDTFLAVFEHIDQYDRDRPFAPWFNRILVNTTLKARKKAAKVRQAEMQVDWTSDEVANALPAERSSDPEQQASRQETRSTVIQAIETLPAGLRAVVALRYFLDMDEHEIARTLGCPLGTVKWRLYAARKRLRRRLKRDELGWTSLHQPQGDAS